NDLLADIMSFTSIIILEIQNWFPNDPFVEAIGIFKLSDELLNNENLLEFGNKELDLLLDIYGKPQFPLFSYAIVDSNNTRTEWLHFKKLIYEDYQNLSIDKLLILLFRYYSSSYPNLIRLLAIISFSSVECKRGFSRQNLIKTKLRTTLNNDILNMLMMVGLEGADEAEFNFNDALDI
ncbi:14660_t:CDS:1, partial [Dentiscutata erythropus]